MSYINTYTGTIFDPLNPDPELIKIEDIAHALSYLCRGNGHTKSFFSVGQHSIACMKEAKARDYSKRVQLACLLHDGSEAYLSDVVRPVKKKLTQYKEIEAPLQAAIYSKWLDGPLTEEETAQVLEVDNNLLYYDLLNLLNCRQDIDPPVLASELNYRFKEFSLVEEEFLELFEMLQAR